MMVRPFDLNRAERLGSHARAGSIVAVFILGALLAGPGRGAEKQAVRSGPQVGQPVLPFTSNQVTGPNRGKQYCYVCEMKDETAVLVFVRKPDAATSRVLQALRDLTRRQPRDRFFGWMVFLGPETTAGETALEKEAYAFALSNTASSVAVSVLGDPAGSPGYDIAREAAATVIAFRGRRVLYNRAYTEKEWTSRAAGSALKDVPALLPASPKP